MLEDKDLLSIQQARRLVEVADQAGAAYRNFSQEQVDRVVAAMAAAAEKNAVRLAELAVEETGRGKVADKITKNLFAAVDIYNYMKDLKTCDVISENKEKRVVEIGVPVGVIAVVVPTTNPTSTTIFKVLSALKGRNTVVVAPHPQAVRCTLETVRVMYEAALAAGAPEGCVTCMDQVSLEGTTQLMRHRKTRLILATGGTGIVRAAYSSGKPAFGVGPGNVPTFIEKSANVVKAVRDIIKGKTFDNGLLCSSEQSIICDRALEKQVLEELRKNQVHFLSPEEQTKLERLIQKPDGGLNADVVGKSPQTIAGMAGFAVGDGVVCLLGFPKGVGKAHPLSMEKLSPILGFFVVDGWEEGCQRCIEILQFGGLGHTMSIHSSDERVILEFGLRKPAYRVCVNTPATLGAVGLTTGVPPSMTLGCGSPGGNITSDNITALHLINRRRLAFEIRPAESVQYAGQETGSVGSTRPAPATETIRALVRSVVEDYLEQKKKDLAPTDLSIPPVEAPPAPRAKSSGIAAAPPPAAPKRGPAVDFVCEEDVKQALKKQAKIVVNAKTIITPAARDVGEGQSVFVWE